MSAGPVDLAELRAIHDRFAFEHLAAVHQAARDVGSNAMRDARDLVASTFKQRTGKMKAGWLYRTYAIGEGATVEIYNSVPYAWAHETGSGEHGPKGKRYPIVARRAKCLAFQSGGKTVFRMRVMHPGVRPRYVGLRAMYGGSPADQKRYMSVIMRSLEAAAKRF